MDEQEVILKDLQVKNWTIDTMFDLKYISQILLHLDLWFKRYKLCKRTF